MEEDGAREEMKIERGKVCVQYVCVFVKRLHSSLCSPKVSPAAAHSERLGCGLPLRRSDTMRLCVVNLRNAGRWQGGGEEKGRGGFGEE